MSSVTYSTREVATMAGVHRDTLLRWLREGRISEPSRDRNNWRIFTPGEVDAVVQYAAQQPAQSANAIADAYQGYRADLPHCDGIEGLRRLNWDFADAS